MNKILRQDAAVALEGNVFEIERLILDESHKVNHFQAELRACQDRLEVLHRLRAVCAETVGHLRR